MLTWTQLADVRPDLTAEGRRQLYRWGIGLGFLATVRPDGGPRVHPVCPVISDDGLHVVVVAGPKQRDLRRDGRYSLHGETYAPPDHDDGFSVSGVAREVTDADTGRRVRAHLLAERDQSVPWPTIEEDVLFELLVEGCLVMRTEDGDVFPKGPTVWRAS
jgi:hypothetical protein